MTALRLFLAVTLCVAIFTVASAQFFESEPSLCDDSAALSVEIANLYLTLTNLRAGLEAGDPTALGEVYEVGAKYQVIALECGYLPENINTLVINTTDINRVLKVLDTLSGDPLRGQLLYDAQELTGEGSRLGCSGCHAAGEVAPITVGTWTRWDEERSKEERFTEYDFRRYAVESILLPWEYFVATYPEYTMPDFYHEQLSYQDLADILIYLESQNELP